MEGADVNDVENLKKLEELITSEEAPSAKRILDLLEDSNVSEEMKENLKSMLTGNAPKVFGSHGGGTLLALVFVLIIFAIILFFGYKLYKSIKDKELKREEKKKAKQLKKKK